MRLFFAVFPPPEIQQGASRVIEAMHRYGDGVSWVKPENLHYTLRFLGEVEDEHAGRAAAAAAAAEAAAGTRAFTATLGELGAFPNAARARVIWLGMREGGDELVGIARDLERALVARGFGKADKPFSPHLTLGRVREARRDWSATLARPRLPDPSPRFLVRRICLVESWLSAQGSIYSVRAEARLAD
jgi:RNA 2',3'-cyclic 3'-phosphodiesterase